VDKRRLWHNFWGCGRAGTFASKSTSSTRFSLVKAFLTLERLLPWALEVAAAFCFLRFQRTGQAHGANASYRALRPRARLTLLKTQGKPL
jgi:hypothetical protein